MATVPAKTISSVIKAQNQNTTRVSKKQKVEKKIEFREDGDEEKMSNLSRQRLEAIMAEAGVRKIIVTSTMRTVEEQAAAMYKNEQTREMHKQKADSLWAKKEVQDDDIKVRAANLENHLQAIDPYKDTFNNKFVTGNDYKSYANNRGLEKQADVPYGHKLAKEAKNIARNDVKKDAVKQNKEIAIDAMITVMNKTNLVNITSHAGKIGLEVFDISFNSMTPKEQKAFTKAVKRQTGKIIYRFGYPKGGPGPLFFNDNCFHVEIIMPNDGVVSEHVGRTA